MGSTGHPASADPRSTAGTRPRRGTWPRSLAASVPRDVPCREPSWSSRYPFLVDRKYAEKTAETKRNQRDNSPTGDAKCGSVTLGYNPLFLPYPNSCKRIAPESFAPISIAWGMDNRVAAVRAINVTPKGTRIELRVPGGDICLHLGLAALIAAGLDGIKNQLDPGPPGPGPSRPRRECPQDHDRLV